MTKINNLNTNITKTKVIEFQTLLYYYHYKYKYSNLFFNNPNIEHVEYTALGIIIDSNWKAHIKCNKLDLTTCYDLEERRRDAFRSSLKPPCSYDYVSSILRYRIGI